MIAARQETAQPFPVLPALPPAISPLDIGTSAYLLKNSRLGFFAQVPIWEPGFLYGNFNKALGISAEVRQTRVRPLCTGKLRDNETGLDFFEARYMSGAQGRFTSPDPVTNTALHLVNPQRWNMYAYVVGNPLAFTDPDGHDAAAVNFSTLAGGAGHLAVLSVHHDGSATYADYGPKGGGKPVWEGNYDVRTLTTKVDFTSKGVPTEASAQALIKEMANLEKVSPDTVSLTYYKTSAAETASLDAYLTSYARFSQGWGSWCSLYVVGANDCVAFANNALGKAGIGRGSEMLDVPNWEYIWYLKNVANATSYSGKKKEKVTSTIHYDMNPSGAKHCSAGALNGSGEGC